MMRCYMFYYDLTMWLHCDQLFVDARELDLLGRHALAEGIQLLAHPSLLRSASAW